MGEDEAGLRHAVRRLLAAGVWASGGLMAAGLALEAGGSLETGHAALLAGILVLMTTPVLRVALLAGGYAFRREWPFFWVSAAVLIVLVGGMILGLRG